MFGKTRREYTYFACYPDARHHADKPWFPDHPNSIWVREDALATAIHDFFATRILGPDRRALLAAHLGRTHQAAVDDITRRRAQLGTHLADLRRRQTKIVAELEDDEEDDLDPETRREFRKRLRERFADLAGQIRTAQAEVDALPTGTSHREDNLDLLDQLPELHLDLPRAPEDLQRNLYDAFDLTVTYDWKRHQATLRATITADAIGSLTSTIEAVTDRRTTTETITPHAASTAYGPQSPVSHVLGAPGRMAQGSGRV